MVQDLEGSGALEIPPAEAHRPAWSEGERLDALTRYDILDTAPDAAFDDIARIAAQVCQAPIAVVNFIADTRQWFKAEVGLGVREMPLDVSFCAHAILQPGLFVVPDTTKDPRFDSNPLVTGEPHLRFYAGALLETSDGLPLGTLCVLDYQPRDLTEEQRFTLGALARQIMSQLELRRSIAQRDRALEKQSRAEAEARRTEAALRESEHELRLITDAVPVLISHVDSGQRYRFANKSYEDWFGPNIQGKNMQEVLGPEVYEARLPWIVRALAGEDSHFDSFAYHQDGSRRDTEVQLIPTRNPDGRVGGFYVVMVDITERKEAERRQALLVRELHHRVKNTLATVQAIMGSTARSAKDMDEFRRSFGGRIVSLAKTHSVLTEGSWQTAQLRDLLWLELEPYDDGTGQRIKLDGPPIELSTDLAVPISMAIHELSTNAAKYGPLSVLGGSVLVRWEVATNDGVGTLHLDWLERNGPPVEQPRRQGFGSRLLERVLTAQIHADVRMAFDPTGLHVVMAIPLDGPASVQTAGATSLTAPPSSPRQPS